MLHFIEPVDAVRERLMVPFETNVMGMDMTVVRIDGDEIGGFVATCMASGRGQIRVPLQDIPLPQPPPPGADAVVAWRMWRDGAPCGV